MAKVNRNAPKRSKASESRYTIFEFQREFPDDATCLEYLVAKLYPDGIFCPTCQRVTKHHRRQARPAYSCQFCGHDEYPLKGTIFEGSATSLTLWFYAIHLMASTRCGISAKQLEREIGVTYKTAWRMFNRIRSLLDQDETVLSGTVEMDEAYIGGRRRGVTGRPSGMDKKVPIFGMAQRKRAGHPGRVVAKRVANARAVSLMPHVKSKVLPKSTVYTDELHSYKGLEGMGYTHERIPHSEKIYVMGDVHTNTIEGFWSLLKSGIRGTYHSVSTKHLQSYLDEYAFRYNSRDATGRGMFDAFLSRVQKAGPAS